MASARSVDLNCGDRRGVCHVQRSRVFAQAIASSNLEQRLVSAVSVRGHKLHEKLGLRRLRGRWIMDWSVCLADAVTRGRKEQGGEALLGLSAFALRSDMASHSRGPWMPISYREYAPAQRLAFQLT